MLVINIYNDFLSLYQLRLPQYFRRKEKNQVLLQQNKNYSKISFVVIIMLNDF